MEYKGLSEQKTIVANQNIKERDYWLAKLSGEWVKSTFPHDFNPQDQAEVSHAAVKFRFTPELSSRLIKMSNQTDHTLHMILVAAMAILLDKYTYNGPGDIILGAPIYKQEKEGQFVNTVLPLRIKLTEDMSFKELLLQVRQIIIEADQNQNYPMDILYRKLTGQSPGNGTPLFDVMVLMESIHDEKYIRHIKANIISLFSRNHQHIEGVLKYHPLLYNESTIKRITNHFTYLLKQVLANVEIKVSDLDILSQQERNRLLYVFNDNKVDFPRDRSIYHFIQQHAEQTPDRIAVVSQDLMVTYKNLNKRANQLARVLRDSGIRTDQPVGILLHRTPGMVESILAVWKAGGAYIPIDTQYPLQRLTAILNDSGSRLLITESQYMDAALSNHYRGKIIPLDRKVDEIHQQDNVNLDLILDMNSLSYIIYTSGSTGKPKGAMVEHIGMMNHIQAKINELRLTPQSVVAQNATHCFDISVWQFFVGLTLAGRTIIYSNHLVLEPDRFLDRVSKDRITILEVVPSYLSVMLETLETAPGNLSSLQYLVVTGEVIKPILVNRWLEKYPGIQVLNAYGPTEASDDITHHMISEPVKTDRVPIGKPLQNFNIYIVNKGVQLSPIGVPGELWVSGPGVGRGYLKDKERTRQAFIDDPFVEEPGVRLYKTGDLGRWLPDGTIDFLGRIDEQVKVRGYRIECGEIECLLMQHPKVKEALVMPREDEKKNHYLVAYLMAEGEVHSSEMEDYLSDRLPGYMIPAYFVQVENFPLTPNGKIDKKSLPDPNTNKAASVLYQGPQTRTQAQLLEIWQEVLGQEKIGINDDFLSLGGDSIKGIRIVNKIQQRLKEIIHVALLFENPTIKDLAAALAGDQISRHRRIDKARAAEFRKVLPQLAPLKPQAAKNPPAVFILSPPRTGSTLLRVILAGHAKIFAPPELELMLFNTLQDRKSELSGPFSYFAEGTIRAIMEIKGCSAEEGKAIMAEFEKQNLTIAQFYGQLQQWLGDQLLVDKTANYSLSLEAMKRAEVYFDSPRYIHLTRHPYAVIQSYQEAKLDQVFRYKHPFTVKELAELVWLVSEQNIRDFLKDIPDQRKYFVKFEELVQHPAEIAVDICDFLGLEFEENMIQVYQNTNRKMTDGLYAESKMIGDVKFFTHSNINAAVVDRWRNNHSEDFLGDISLQMAQSLGYLTEMPTPGHPTIQCSEKWEHYPLSTAQKRLWILHQFEKSRAVYNIPGAYVFEGKLNRQALEKAYESLIRRHESLRTTFIMQGGNPREKIHDYDSAKFALAYVDLKSNKSGEKQLQQLVQQEVSTPFDLVNGPLLKVKLIHLSETNDVLLFTMHHIISDGWSMQVLAKEIFSLYNAYHQGKHNPLPRLPLQYRDYVQWQTSEKQEEPFKRMADYWKEQFNEIPVLQLPADYPRPQQQSFAGSTIHFDFSSEETRAINHLAQSQGATLFMLLLALFNILLSKLSNQEDIIVGIPMAGRKHGDLEMIIGMFVNTLALRNYPAGEKNFNSWLTEVKEQSLKAFENQDYPMEELLETIDLERDVSRNPLFDTAFALQNFSENAEVKPVQTMAGVNIKPYPYEHQTSKFDLTLFANETEGKLGFIFEYCTQLFGEETIHRFISGFKRVITSVLENPGIKISRIEIITGKEKHQLLYQFNNTEAEFPKDQTIHQAFVQQAGKFPHHPAVKFKEQQLSYGELNQHSNQLARTLRRKGVKTETVVGIMARHSLEMIVGIIAILKAGGAYLPIDPQYPQERIRYILKDSGSPLLLTNTSESQVANTVDGCEILDLEDNHWYQGESQNLERLSTAFHLAYVIYTSGSTGKPKGTLIRHQSLNNLCHWHNQQFSVSSHDRASKYAGFGFDASVWEIFPYLIAGASIYMIEEEMKTDINGLNGFFEKNRITIAFLPTQICEQFMTLENHSLRFLLTGGDKLRSYVKRNYQLVNNYGPTENTVVSTSFIVDEHQVNIPIGKPINNTQLYILNKHQQLQPLGVPGELFVSGIGLSRGYLNQPELTAEKFCLQRPGGRFSAKGDRCRLQVQVELSKTSSPTKPSLIGTPCHGAPWTPRKNFLLEGTNKRIYSHRSYMSYMSYIYRTGDLAKWKADGNIEFLGRIDHQVKIRGFRIELGEIENQLFSHQKVKDAVVIAREAENGEKYLCAYYIPTSAIKKSKPESLIPELRQHLTQNLPDYMIPSYFAALEEIPLTPNGKVHHRALPAPRVEVNGKYIAPGNKIEQKLVEIWSEVLGIETGLISMDASFFELGGHSLKAVLMTSKIHQALEVKVSLTKIFTLPTISQLADYIANALKERHESIKPVEQKEYYPLSSAQKRLYILQRMDFTNTGYNIPFFIPWERLEEEIHPGKLEAAVKKLIARHESLRTSFEIIDDEPVQRIHDQVEFEIEYYNNEKVEEKHFEGTRGLAPLLIESAPGTHPSAALISSFFRSFDLSKAPLLRLAIIKVEAGKFILMVVIHHIISDGLSQRILEQDFLSLYQGGQPKELRIQYKDYSEWQQTNIRKEAKGKASRLKAQKDYWLKEFADEIPIINLPLDFPRPVTQSFVGSTLTFQVGNQETTVLKEIAAQEQVTLFMLILAIFNIMLSKISGQEDIIVGADVAGRSHADLENIVGMFVNTLALRNFPVSDRTFKGFLKEVKERTLKAFENQDYQFEDLVNQLVANRDASRNPIFDVVFSFWEHNQEWENIPAQQYPDWEPQLRHSLRKTAKFDLNLSGIETPQGLSFTIEYCTKLFTKETIEIFIAYFKEIVSSVIKNPDAVIGEIEMINKGEKQMALKTLKKREDDQMPEMIETRHMVSLSSEAEFNF